MTVNENIGTKILAFDSYKEDSDVMWWDVLKWHLYHIHDSLNAQEENENSC